MIPGLIILILIFSFILIKAADITVVGIRRVSKLLKLESFSIAAIILALGTSFPELFIGITSALEDSQNLSLGLVLGSNIANLALVAGGAALIHGRIRVRGEYFRHDVWISLVAGILPIFLIIDKSLSRVDGLILITMYLAYASGFFRRRYIQIGEEQAEESFFYSFIRRVNHIKTKESREFGRLFIGLALLLFSADMIVRFSTILAEAAGIPLLIIGLVVLALGSSLPELAFAFKSLEEHEPQMFFGNLLGSIIANSTLVIGVAALISPITVVAFNEYVTAVVAFILTFLLFWYFIRTKHRLDRWEALMLIIIYLTFVVVEFIP